MARGKVVASRQAADAATPVTPAGIAAALAAPFPPEAVDWKPQNVRGTRALAVPYIDARTVQARLDDVLGVAGWKDGYQVLPDGSVVCRLKVRVGGEWITRADVGGQSDQNDEGDRRKAAFSDALTRAAVKFGVGRYIYWLPLQWLGYDPQRRQFTERPRLPDWALPGYQGGHPLAVPAVAPEPAAEPPAEAKPPQGRDAAAAPAAPAAPGPQARPKAQVGGKVYLGLLDSIRQAVTHAALNAVAQDAAAALPGGLITEAQLASVKQAGSQRRAAIDEAAERAAIQHEPSSREARLAPLLRQNRLKWPAVLAACGLPTEASWDDLREGEFEAALTYIEAVSR